MGDGYIFHGQGRRDLAPAAYRVVDALYPDVDDDRRHELARAALLAQLDAEAALEPASKVSPTEIEEI
jgi:hypothetical protein